MLYKISRPFWDGSVMHDSGSVLTFEEGTAPKGSVEHEEEVVKEESKKATAKVKE